MQRDAELAAVARAVDIDFVIGHMLSAISAEQIPSAERQGFAEEVRAAIIAVTPSGRVVETVSVRAVIGRTNHV